jgi:hypothetical protein
LQSPPDEPRGIDIDAAFRDRREDVEEVLACFRCGMDPAAVIEGAMARGYERALAHLNQQ